MKKSDETTHETVITIQTQKRPKRITIPIPEEDPFDDECSPVPDSPVEFESDWDSDNGSDDEGGAPQTTDLLARHVKSVISKMQRKREIDESNKRYHESKYLEEEQVRKNLVLSGEFTRKDINEFEDASYSDKIRAFHNCEHFKDIARDSELVRRECRNKISHAIKELLQKYDYEWDHMQSAYKPDILEQVNY